MIEMQSKFVHMVINLPNRFICHQYCYDSPAVRPAMTMLQMMLGKKGRIRFRSHYGSSLEVVYSLVSYGITLDPRVSDPQFRERQALEYIERRRVIEEQWRQQELALSRENKILYPSPTDVLCGRGRPYQQAPGNLNMAKHIAEASAEYQLVKKKKQKTEFAMRIVRRVQEDGGRFIKRSDRFWYVVSDSDCRTKVSQAIRMVIKKQREEPQEANLLDSDGTSVSPMDEDSESDDEELRDHNPSKKLRLNGVLF